MDIPISYEHITQIHTQLYILKKCVKNASRLTGILDFELNLPNALIQCAQSKESSMICRLLKSSLGSNSEFRCESLNVHMLVT